MSTASDIRSIQCRAELRAIQDKYGYDHFRREATAIVKARLQVDENNRPKRERFKPALYKKLYHHQRGICGICDLGMVMPKSFPGNLAIDHINPNRIDGFNDPENLQLTHDKCNSQKGGNSLEEESKRRGETYLDMIKKNVKDWKTL